MDESLFNRIYDEIRRETYVCSVCGKAIFPDVSFSDERVNIKNRYYERRGERGNRVLAVKACSDCMEEYFG